MDSEGELSIKRMDNEFIVGKALFTLSENAEAKTLLKVPAAETFYSAVITHAYYAIFYSAKAYLMKKSLTFSEQGQHQAVYFAFRRFVREGKIAAELLELYEEVKIKAENLLEIFEREEANRAKFTYKTLAQANKEPAENSLSNAETFLAEMKELIGKK